MPSMENRKKRYITEEDTSTLLQRYTATTVLAVLQEVYQYDQVKIDWNELVKRSSTGISCPREYRMLWHHLAYRDDLFERLDDGGEPLDDDSDLECELEVFPAVSADVNAEIAASVKVLMASGLGSDCTLPKKSNAEGLHTVNIPNSQPCKVPSEGSKPPCLLQGTSTTCSGISALKQSVPPSVTSTEGMDTNGNNPPKKKRKHWSEAEDLELIAAVQKRGEGNWANILKADFKGDRTASQLSQRWAIIRKRHGNLNLGGSNPSTGSTATVGSVTGTQLSEAQLATRRAVSMALNMPMKSLRTGGTILNSTLRHPAQNQTRSDPRKPTLLALSSGPSVNSSSSVQTSPKENNINNSHEDMAIKAAAVAAGARIASPSDAASLMKAAKNAVHIIPRGGSLIKAPSATVNTTIKSANQTNPAVLSSHPVSVPAPSQSIPGKDIMPAVQNSPADAAIASTKADIPPDGEKDAVEPGSKPPEPPSGEDGQCASKGDGSAPVKADPISPGADTEPPVNQYSDASAVPEISMSAEGDAGGNEPEKGETTDPAVSENCEKECSKEEALN